MYFKSEENKSLPLVEIIIPTYNRAHIVVNAIESVLAQNYENLKIIIIDDGSKDNTLDILRRYDGHAHINIIALGENRGVTGAKNAGLDALSKDADYFGIFDSDDIMFADALHALVNVMQSDSYSQVMGLCQNAHTGQIISLYNGQPCQASALLTFKEALSGKIGGEFWQIADARLVGTLRFDSRALGAESIFWNELMRLKPAAILDKVVRQYDDSGSDRVSRGSYSREKAIGKMWVYRAYLEHFEYDLEAKQKIPLQQEAIKYALLGGDYRYGLSKIVTSGLRPMQKIKLFFWPLYAVWRQNRVNKS